MNHNDSIRLIIILTILVFLSDSIAQNLLHNASFEEFKKNWDVYDLYPITGSYYSEESHVKFFHLSFINEPSFQLAFHRGVPNNYHGYQYPRTGNGYVTIGEIWFFPVFPLKETLRANQCYQIRYHVSRCDYEACAGSALDGYFSKDSLTFQMLAKDTILPQFANLAGVISDTMNWIEIAGEYIANGDEKYFALGLFYGDARKSYGTKICADSTIHNFNGGEQISPSVIRPDLAVMYYLDDVAIWECDTPEIPADAGSDRNICRGDVVEIGSMSQMDEYMYFWSDRSWHGPRHTWDTLATTPKFNVSPTKTTTYYLWLVDFKWEHTYDSVTIFVEECNIDLEIPNVMTPNGDGFNDYFMIRNPNLVNYTLEVFNRWGDIIFVGNQNYFWDGTFNGKPVASGVYYYALDAVAGDGDYKQQFNGSITVLRE